MTDTAELIERLRENDEAIFLPVLGEAATALERLQAESERLRDGLCGLLDAISDDQLLDSEAAGRAYAALGAKP